MGIFNFLFENKNKKIRDFVERDAIVVDVRSREEYNNGAISGSKNIPLQVISSKVSEIKGWNKPIILCCASGIRSGSAAGILRSNGIEAVNGEGWQNLSKKL